MEQARILSIVWYRIFPATMGGQKGIAHFNESIAEYAELHCLCARSNVTGETFAYDVLPELPVSKLQFINPFTWKKIFRLIRKLKPTHLLIEHPYYGLAAIRAKKKFGIPLIVHEHNIEWQRFKSMKRFGWRLLKWFEGFVLRRADLVLFKSEEDRQAAIKYHRIRPGKTHIVPYGTWLKQPGSADEHQENRIWLSVLHPIPENHLILYFNGTFDYAPNREALEHLSDHIFPLLDKKGIAFALLLTGKNLPDSFIEKNNHRFISFMEQVDDLAPYYTGCDVFINPVLTGGGVKTKLVEALAHNAPCVSTKSGAAGIPPSLCGENLAVCADNDWEAFVNAIITAKRKQPATPPGFYETLHWQRIAQETVAKINGTAEK